MWESLKRSKGSAYSTVWIERLRKVHKLRELVVGRENAAVHAQQMAAQRDSAFLDFADMIETDKQQTAVQVVTGKNRLVS